MTDFFSYFNGKNNSDKFTSANWCKCTINAAYIVLRRKMKFISITNLWNIKLILKKDFWNLFSAQNY